MRILSSTWTDWEPSSRASSVTVGVLDGVHRGHRALLARLDGRYEKTVLTFDPHPVEVLRPGTAPRLITTIGERIELLGDAGVSQVGVLDLSEIKDLRPEAFIEEILLAKLDMRHMVLGPDFRFGKDRTGDVGLLRKLGDEHGFEVETIDLVQSDDGPVSSSRIRQLIETGKPAEAARQLTTRYKVTGPVVRGDNRGAGIGFPTANIAPPARKVVPAVGVYAAFAHVAGSTGHAAVNVGIRPTFGGGELLIEAYIMDFEEDIYGEELTVEFVEYLRPELHFSNVDDLVAQIREDVVQAAKLLESTASNVG